MKILSFVVKVEVHEEVKIPQLANYIREAVGNWGGQYHPDDLLFSYNIGDVTVKSIPKEGTKNG